MLSRAARRLRDRLASRRVDPSAPTGATAPESATPPYHECESYPGYDDADVARLELLRATGPLAGRAGFVTDFVGTRTAIDQLPGADRFDGQVLADLPIPDDRLHAETAEYAALALAFSLSDDERFQLVELGAGWAPWMAAAGLVARRRGITDIRLVGVEADDRHFEYARRHLTDNGLRPAGDALTTELDGVRCELLRGAISWEDGELFFPVDGDAMDYGFAASTCDATRDYRGVELTQRPVTAFGLVGLLDGRDIVDLLHVDIQGTEHEVLGRSAEALERQVKVMCVGTHSRKIEGELLSFWHEEGWRLHGEKPCRFRFDPTAASLEAMTFSDGVQTWVNPGLAGPH